MQGLGIPNVACKLKSGKKKKGGMIRCASVFFLGAERLAELEFSVFAVNDERRRKINKKQSLNAMTLRKSVSFLMQANGYVESERVEPVAVSSMHQAQVRDRLVNGRPGHS